jgi:hypothetical protein
MLARPKPGTREHILLWLSSQDPKRKYDWSNATTCACGRYAREVLDISSNLEWTTFCLEPRGKPLFELNRMASVHRTYGALHEHALAAWSK